MNAATRAAVARLLGARVCGVQSVSGGDINEAFALELTDGRRVFAKTNPSAAPSFFPAEARGLRWLGEARALRVPEVLGVSGSGSERGAEPTESAFLLLEWLEPAPRAAGFEERLGQGLAALHRSHALDFGLDHDNFVGSLPQSNQSAPSWAEFYRDRRLVPLLQQARQRGLLDLAFERDAERLLGRLPELVGPSEPPARLHGDLWGGNLHTAATGEPVLIDPAAYGGHREIDLAMMRLFGGFPPRVFAAYRESHPLAAGHAERLELYQLYPLLVHLVLFGASYRERVGSCLQRYA
ncbi:MAG: fructosamine kinase family protein [Deltaproteobacteria bacterium]